MKTIPPKIKEEIAKRAHSTLPATGMASVAYVRAKDSKDHWLFTAHEKKDDNGKHVVYEIPGLNFGLKFNKYESEEIEIYYMYLVQLSGSKHTSIQIKRNSVEAEYERSFNYLKLVKEGIDTLTESKIFDESKKFLKIKESY